LGHNRQIKRIFDDAYFPSLLCVREIVLQDATLGLKAIPRNYQPNSVLNRNCTNPSLPFTYYFKDSRIYVISLDMIDSFSNCSEPPTSQYLSLFPVAPLFGA
jgi:hypothetical protein